MTLRTISKLISVAVKGRDPSDVGTYLLSEDSNPFLLKGISQQEIDFSSIFEIPSDAEDLAFEDFLSFAVILRGKEKLSTDLGMPRESIPDVANDLTSLLTEAGNAERSNTDLLQQVASLHTELIETDVKRSALEDQVGVLTKALSESQKALEATTSLDDVCQRLGSLENSLAKEVMNLSGQWSDRNETLRSLVESLSVALDEKQNRLQESVEAVDNTCGETVRELKEHAVLMASHISSLFTRASEYATEFSEVLKRKLEISATFDDLLQSLSQIETTNSLLSSNLNAMDTLSRYSLAVVEASRNLEVSAAELTRAQEKFNTTQKVATGLTAADAVITISKLLAKPGVKNAI